MRFIFNFLAALVKDPGFLILLLLVAALIVAAVIGIKYERRKSKKGTPPGLSSRTAKRIAATLDIVSVILLLVSFFVNWMSGIVLFVSIACLVISIPFWAQAEAAQSVEKTKKPSAVAKRIAIVLVAISLILMLAGYLISPVPIGVFYVGYALLWIAIPPGVAAKDGWSAGAGSAIVLVIVWVGLSCSSIIPIPVIEKKFPNATPEVTEEDDRLEDKNPPYLEAFTEKRDWKGWLCYFNKSASVVGLDLAKATRREKKLSGTIHPNFRQALAAAEEFECELLPSVELIDGFTKYFDDRLLAAIEMHLHEGSSIFPGGKQGFLSALLDEVLKQPEAPARDEAAAYVAAAIQLGGGKTDIPEAVQQLAQSFVDVFLRSPLNSKPVGFYTKTETLKDIFRRDRFLQQSLGRRSLNVTAPESDLSDMTRLPAMIRLAEALLKRPDLLDAYSRFRILAEKIHNPDVSLNLEDLLPYRDLFDNERELFEALRNSERWKKLVAKRGGNSFAPGIAFWPFASSKENTLFSRLYRGAELPETAAMDDLVAAIRDGRLSLEPEPDSGWYDRQLYSLETLLLPQKAHEADKLLMHAKYKKRLREAFEAMLTKRRETHVKSLFIHVVAGEERRRLPASPELSLEPCATNYLRTARAYSSLVDSIRSELTDAALVSLKIEGSDKGMLREIDDSIALFYGFYLMVCNDLGMAPKLEAGEIAGLPSLQAEIAENDPVYDEFILARLPDVSDGERSAWFSAWRRAKEWLESMKSQKFLNEDVRVIVPVLSNYRGTKVRYWTVLGTRLLKIRSYYARRPKVGVAGLTYQEETGELPDVDPEEIMEEGFAPRGYRWKPKEYVIPVQVFAEVTLGPEPLTREEFRDICDRGETEKEIIKALRKASGDGHGLLPIVAVGAAIIIMLVIVMRTRASRRRSAS
jgi:hypothetical protein